MMSSIQKRRRRRKKDILRSRRWNTLGPLRNSGQCQNKSAILDCQSLAFREDPYVATGLFHSSFCLQDMITNAFQEIEDDWVWPPVWCCLTSTLIPISHWEMARNHQPTDVSGAYIGCWKLPHDKWHSRSCPTWCATEVPMLTKFLGTLGCGLSWSGGDVTKES